MSDSARHSPNLRRNNDSRVAHDAIAICREGGARRCYLKRQRVIEGRRANLLRRVVRERQEGDAANANHLNLDEERPIVPEHLAVATLIGTNIGPSILTTGSLATTPLRDDGV